MSIPKREELMMVADYSPGDKLSDKENKKIHTDNPLKDESINRLLTDYKQEDVKMTRLSENGKTTGQSRESDSESNQESKTLKRKQKHRRRRGGKNHRKWKPYDTLSWSEKQELEEKETMRANQKREEAFLSGHPVAPYNTTQFLMEDHEAISPDLHRHNSKDSNVSTDSSSDFYEEDENDGFQHKNFLDTFNDIRKQELMNRSKEELVRDYVDLELKLELMEQSRKRKRDSAGQSSSDNNSLSSASDGERDVDVSEYLRLKAENDSLKGQNTELRNKLNTLHSGSKQ